MNAACPVVFHAFPDARIDDPALTRSVLIREALQPFTEKSAQAAVGLLGQPSRLAEFRGR